MLKKLSIAGLALIASSGLAFADVSDNATSSTTDTSVNNAAGDSTTATTTTTTTTTKKHKKHHHKKHHRHHHHVAAAAPADQDTMMAPKGDYKGEVAAPCPTCPVPFHPGAYVGLSVGSLVNYISAPAVYNGLQGELFGGYGWLWDQWYAALEIHVEDSAELINYSAVGGGSIKSTWGYGLSVLPGYTIVDNVLAYLRLGVVRTRFSAGNTWLTGGQVGLGLDTALCTNWDLRGEWVYSFYNSSGAVGNPKTQQFNLGLIYKFEL